MKRRNFLTTAAGALAAASVPSALPAGSPEAASRGYEGLLLLRDLHPMAIFSKIAELGEEFPYEAMTLTSSAVVVLYRGDHGGHFYHTHGFHLARHPELVGELRAVIPEALRFEDVRQADPALNALRITYGQNVWSDYTGDETRWRPGSRYAIVYYSLPDQSKLVFKIGQQVTGIPSDTDHNWVDAPVVEVTGPLADRALSMARFEADREIYTNKS